MIDFRYDTQLLIDGENLDEDVVNEYFVKNFEGDCLLAGRRRHLHKNSFSYQ